MSWHYDWGYHSSDEQYVHVSRVTDEVLTDTAGDYQAEHPEDLFDVTLYDPDCPATDGKGGSAMAQSLRDLRELIGYANAALKAGLAPEPVADRGEQ